jgi:hypothetical protein
MHCFFICFGNSNKKENNNISKKNICAMLNGPLVVMNWRVLGRELRCSFDC